VGIAFILRPCSYKSAGPFEPTADDEAAAKLWKVYVDQAKEYEENLLKEWKADMEALLIFVRELYLLVCAILI